MNKGQDKLHACIAYKSSYKHPRNTSNSKSTNRIALQQFAQGSADKNLELDNLGFHVVLLRKPAKTVKSTINQMKTTNSVKNRPSKISQTNENNNNNNTAGDSKKNESDNNNGTDAGASHRSDDLLSRLTYKV